MRVFRYLRENSRPIVVILAAVFAITATKVDAGWVDDWLSSKTSTDAGYFQGQSRGYATAGSFSARWPSRNDNLMSIMPPKLSMGCGGIDFFGGSLSFLDPDMLVQKLQNILTNSAFLAFDMALDTLCPKCSALMKAAEDLSNNLNSMAINDCNAAKGIAANLRPAMEGVAAAFWEGKGSEAISDGVTTSYNKFKSSIPSMPKLSEIETWWNQQKGISANTRSDTTGCAGVLSDIFPSDKGRYPVSVMEVVGVSLGMPSDHIKLMRGMVGDIIVHGAAGNYTTQYRQGCSRNVKMDLKQFQSGDIDAMDKNGACAAATATNADLEQYVSNMMLAISTKLKNSTALTAAEKTFITSVPVAVLYGMRVAVGSGQESTMVSSLAGITASGWMMKSLQDLIGRADGILRVAANVNSNLVNGSKNCNLNVHAQEFAEKHKDMLANVNRILAFIGSNMAQQFQEYETTTSIARRLEELNTQIRANVARNFGPSIAARAMRGM